MSYSYAPPQSSVQVKPDRSIDVARTIINCHLNNATIDSIFVAGCGEGNEAVLLSQLYNAPTIGVDLGLTEPAQFDLVEIRNGDLMHLDYPDRSFQLIYSYHVIEHVPQPSVMLRDLSKMLQDDGLLYIGFPNINRAVGYLGSKHATRLDMVRWNAQDYGMRLKRRFRNEYGAHAGFSEKEFMTLAKPYFKEITPIRNEYIRLKYPNRLNLVNSLISSGLSEYFFPANYFICRV